MSDILQVRSATSWVVHRCYISTMCKLNTLGKVVLCLLPFAEALEWTASLATFAGSPQTSSLSPVSPWARGAWSRPPAVMVVWQHVTTSVSKGTYQSSLHQCLGFPLSLAVRVLLMCEIYISSQQACIPTTLYTLCVCVVKNHWTETMD